jgi:hypothetical protein
MYGCKGKHGNIIIALKEDHIEDFMETKKQVTLQKLQKVHEELD